MIGCLRSCPQAANYCPLFCFGRSGLKYLLFSVIVRSWNTVKTSFNNGPLYRGIARRQQVYKYTVGVRRFLKKLIDQSENIHLKYGLSYLGWLIIILTLYALMNSSLWFFPVNLRRHIVYIEGSQVKLYIILWGYSFVIANREDPDEMPHLAFSWGGSTMYVHTFMKRNSASCRNQGNYKFHFSCPNEINSYNYKILVMPCKRFQITSQMFK